MKLTATAIFQNEAPYLKEWIEFHQQIGVEYFYLFDHFSTDSPEKILEPFLKQGAAKLTRWPIPYSNVYEWTEVQCLAYERAIHWATGKTRWLAILDVDEFLFPVAGKLVDILDDFEEFGGVCVNWQIYGTSNIKKIPKGKRMIEVLNFKAPKDQIGNRHVKSIVRPERVAGLDNAHSMKYKDGFYQVNTKKERFEGCISPTVEIDLLRINHYTLRDEHYLKTKKIPRLQKWWPSVESEKFGALNLVEDKIIHQFLLEI